MVRHSRWSRVYNTVATFVSVLLIFSIVSVTEAVETHQPLNLSDYKDSGKNTSTGAPKESNPHYLSSVIPGAIKSASRTITVLNDDVRFLPNLISVKVGETIAFKVINQGTLLHEFSVGRAEMREEHRARLRMMQDLGMIQPDRLNFDLLETDGKFMDEAAPHMGDTSIFIEPNATEWIVLEFSKSDILEFVCNIPGHQEAGSITKIKMN